MTAPTMTEILAEEIRETIKHEVAKLDLGSVTARMDSSDGSQGQLRGEIKELRAEVAELRRQLADLAKRERTIEFKPTIHPSKVEVMAQPPDVHNHMPAAAAPVIKVVQAPAAPADDKPRRTRRTVKVKRDKEGNAEQYDIDEVHGG